MIGKDQEQEILVAKTSKSWWKRARDSRKSVKRVTVVIWTCFGFSKCWQTMSTSCNDDGLTLMMMRMCENAVVKRMRWDSAPSGKHNKWWDCGPQRQKRHPGWDYGPHRQMLSRRHKDRIHMVLWDAEHLCWIFSSQRRPHPKGCKRPTRAEPVL